MVLNFWNLFFQISSYNLQVRATDSGVPELVNFVFVQVQVTDVNDNPPLFSQHNYSAFVHVCVLIVARLWIVDHPSVS